MKILILICLNLFSTLALAECPSINFSSSLIMKERVISMGSTFDISADGKKIGIIEETILSLSREFVLKNTNGQKVATAKKRIISFGSVVDVYDCNHKLIGVVEENIAESMFSIKSHYSVKNASHHQIAKSEMISFFNTNIDIKANGQNILSMKRDMINLLSDTWRVEMDSKDVNPLLLIMIPAFKTSSDNQKEKEDKDK